MPIGLNSDTQIGLYLPGSVVQVLNFEQNFYQTYTGNSINDIKSNSTTIWEATITPRYNTSKIFVLVSIPFFHNQSASSSYGGFILNRKIGSGSYSAILNPSSNANGSIDYGTYSNASSMVEMVGRHNIPYLDSPSTTLACSYKISWQGYGGGAIVQIPWSGPTTVGKSFIYLLELQQ